MHHHLAIASICVHLCNCTSGYKIGCQWQPFYLLVYISVFVESFIIGLYSLDHNEEMVQQIKNQLNFLLLKTHVQCTYINNTIKYTTVYAWMSALYLPNSPREMRLTSMRSISVSSRHRSWAVPAETVIHILVAMVMSTY